jgi:hypothetical protein
MTKTPLPTLDDMTARILGAYQAASAEEIFLGTHWYDSARVVATELAERYGVTPDVAACVIAAHSMNTRWNMNIRNAEAQLAGAPVGLGASIAMATAAIANSTDPFSAIVGPKINPFAHNIAGNEYLVATDRWAQRAAGADTFIGRIGVRATLIDAYRKAAAAQGISPAVMQAIVWVHVRGSAD